jgi:hypothetical protein
MNLASFTQLVAKPLEATTLWSPPHRCRTKPPPISTPRRNSGLAKKAINRTPTVAVAQNVLIRKLGLVTGPQVVTAAFEKYLKLF